MSGFKDLSRKLHITEPDDNEAPSASVTHAAPAGVAQPVSYTAPVSSYVPSVVGADPDTVAKLKDRVLKSSPILAQFMQNVDKVRAQFPNDETSCMKAALAFTGVDKTVLSHELSTTVNAALLHTKGDLDTQRNKAHDAEVGTLQQQLTALSNDVTQLQQTLTAKQQSISSLQAQIHTVETTLQQQDSVVKSSIAQVEQEIAHLGQTFNLI